MAGAASFPERLDGSKTSLYTNFSPSDTDGTVTDSHAVYATLNSNDVNSIRWMLPNEKGLLVGTARGEWKVSPSTLGVAVTPTNITAKPQTHYGSGTVAPIMSGRTVLFLQRDGRKLREISYVFQVDGFQSPDMTLLSNHITSGGVIEMAFQEQAYPIIWCARADGVLLGFTYERDQNVTAWHRHELGGQSNAAGTTVPIVESVASVQAQDGTRDELYAVVQRYINGGTKRYIEYMTKPWEEGDSQDGAFFVDCGWSQVDAVASTTVTGLWHLEGETLGVIVDGAEHPAVTVTNGTATLNYAGYIKTLGYYYNSDGQTMPIEAGAQDGSAQGKIKRISRVGFWVVDTLGLKFGLDASNLNEILLRDFGNDPGDRFGEATPLYTGIFRERFEGDFDKLGQVYWRCSGPFPATVLAIMQQVDTSDDT